MSDIYHYSFRCSANKAEDKAIIDALSENKDKTAFIKQCISQCIKSKFTYEDMKEIKAKLNTLIELNYNCNNYIKELEDNSRKSVLENVDDRANDIVKDLAKGPVNADIYRDIYAIKEAVDIENVATANDNTVIEKKENLEDSEFEKNVLDCMSQFINM